MTTVETPIPPEEASTPTAFATPTTRLQSETAGAEISPRVARALIAIFLAILCIPAVVQVMIDIGSGGNIQVLNILDQRPTAKSLEKYSADLARNSWLSEAIRKAGEYDGKPDFATSGVLPGADGFLFLKFEVDTVQGAGFLDPQFKQADSIVPAMLDFDQRLKKLGIHLIILPVPAKASIYPEKVWPEYPLASGPALNPDYAKWLATMKSAGVDVLDLTDVYWKAKSASGEPLYHKTDTHWSPRGWELAADQLADRIRPWLGEYEPMAFSSTQQQTDVWGDLARLARVRFNPAFPVGKMTLTIAALDGKSVGHANGGPVLLIGDSYCDNMIDKGGLGQQLMLRLKTFVDTEAGHGGACVNSQRALLSKRPELLKGRKVIVWEFGGRFFRTEEVEKWETYPLAAP